ADRTVGPDVYYTCTYCLQSMKGMMLHCGYSLTDLLDGVEKAHKAQIQLYTSGHLNHDKLFRPQVLVKHSYWESAKNPGLIPRRRAQFTAPSEASRKSKNTSTSYAGTPTPTRAKSASHSCRQPWASKASSRAPVSISLGAAAFKPQQKDTPEETEGGVGLFQKKLIQEELEVPELKILKYKPTRNSQLCVMQGIKDEYQFLPSYLAGVTKTDQFHKFMQFQKDFIAKRDLLENDFIGSKSAEQHERKLAQALRNICDCNRPHFYRLQAVGDVFEDICNSSLIFGDILREVKNEYELYVVILLDSLPTTQYRVRSFLDPIHITTSIISHPGDHHSFVLAEKERAGKSETPPLSSVEQLTSLRSQIIMKWEEIRAMEREIKDTMTFAAIANIREKTVKELEVRLEVDGDAKWLSVSCPLQGKPR
uniref:Chromosome 6 open reading frame 118 n=1 Tax=Varanus komodoensis TaxID=61221 RepID=A0A8D2LPI5_VARKO